MASPLSLTSGGNLTLTGGASVTGANLSAGGNLTTRGISVTGTGDIDLRAGALLSVTGVLTGG